MQLVCTRVEVKHTRPKQYTKWLRSLDTSRDGSHLKIVLIVLNKAGKFRISNINYSQVWF
jgi:hypothetical protein